MRYIRIFSLLGILSLFGCVKDIQLVEEDFKTIKKCVYVNILKESKLSCNISTESASFWFGLIGTLIGSISDSKKADEMNKVLHNFNMDKVFSFKMYEAFSKHLPLVPTDEVDTISQIQEIKREGDKENEYNYLLEKEIGDCVLQSYISWYGLEKKFGDKTKVSVKVEAKLIRIQDNKILWRKSVDSYKSSKANSYGYDEFIANNGEILRQELVNAIDIVVEELKKDFLNMK